MAGSEATLRLGRGGASCPPPVPTGDRGCRLHYVASLAPVPHTRPGNIGVCTPAGEAPASPRSAYTSKDINVG